MLQRIAPDVGRMCRGGATHSTGATSQCTPASAEPVARGRATSFASAMDQSERLDWGATRACSPSEIGGEAAAVILKGEPCGDLLSHGLPHYHRRGLVSRSCSGWEGVVPRRYGRKAKEWPGWAVGASQARFGGAVKRVSGFETVAPAVRFRCSGLAAVPIGVDRVACHPKL